MAFINERINGRGVTTPLKCLERRGNGRGCSASAVLAVGLGARCAVQGLGRRLRVVDAGRGWPWALVARRVELGCSTAGQGAEQPVRRAAGRAVHGPGAGCRTVAGARLQGGSEWRGLAHRLLGEQLGASAVGAPGVQRLGDVGRAWKKQGRGERKVGREEGEVARERRLCRKATRDARPAGKAGRDSGW
jgi:hypothetical protein